MTNFRYTVEIIADESGDLRKGKKVRLIHRYEEKPLSYFLEQELQIAAEEHRERIREATRKAIEKARSEGATHYDLGNGIVMVWPSLVAVPEGVQPLSNFKPTLPTLLRLAL